MTRRFGSIALLLLGLAACGGVAPEEGTGAADLGGKADDAAEIAATPSVELRGCVSSGAFFHLPLTRLQPLVPEGFTIEPSFDFPETHGMLQIETARCRAGDRS